MAIEILRITGQLYPTTYPNTIDASDESPLAVGSTGL